MLGKVLHFFKLVKQMQQQAGRKDMERLFLAQNLHVDRKLFEVWTGFFIGSLRQSLPKEILPEIEYQIETELKYHQKETESKDV